MEIAIVAHQETWEKDFAVLPARIRAVLGPLALRVDHIGSTAMPGLASKDRINVQVTVATQGDLDAASARATVVRIRVCDRAVLGTVRERRRSAAPAHMAWCVPAEGCFKRRRARLCKALP